MGEKEVTCEENKQAWIALYTQPRREKVVARQLTEHGMESYLPMWKVVRQWSDRRKKVEVPLIPSYVFLHIDPRLYIKVYDFPGIVRVLTFNGRVAIVQPEEIELLRRATVAGKEKIKLESSTPKYHLNDEVEIIEGLFSGYRGVVVRDEKTCRVSIRIEELQCAVVVEVPFHSVRALRTEVIARNALYDKAI